MPSERNKSNLPRDYSFHRDLIQDPERLRDRIASSRDDEPAFNEERILRENYALSSNISKIALIGAAVNLISKRPLGNLGMEVAGKLTSMLNRGQRAASKTYLNIAATAGGLSGKIDEAAAANLRMTAEGTPLISHLQILEDTKRNLNTLHQADIHGTFFSGVEGTRSISQDAQDIVTRMRESIRERYTRQFNSAEGVEDLTVDKLIAMSTDSIQHKQIVDLFGKDQIDGLVDAKRWGLLAGDQRIDERIFLDTATKKVIDTRILSGQHVGGILKRLTDEIQLPFVNLRVSDIFAGPIRHLFGKGEASAIVRAPEVSDPAAHRLVIGEDLFKIAPRGDGSTAAKLEFVDSGYRASGKNKIGEAVLASRGQLKSQTRMSSEEIESTSRNPVLKWFNALLDDIGIGRKYATQESFLKRATTDLVKRRTKGTPVVKETTRIDETAKEVARRTGTSEVDGSKLDLIDQSRQRVQRQSRPDPRDRGYFEETKRDVLAALGDETSIEYVQREQRSGILKKVVKPVKGVSQSDYGVRPATAIENVSAGPVGRFERRQTRPLDSFAFKSDISSRLADVANFMTTRLNDLIGATTGLGFRATPGMFGFAGNTAKIFGMAAGGALALEGVKYADYLSGIPTGGYKASNLLLDAYSVAKISAQFLREFAGVSPAARYMEDLMPGSVESSASDFIRTIAPFAIALKILPNKSGLLIAGGISAAIGELPFPGITETPKETRDILSGEQPVPMRSGRYWMLGKQPFSGGKISYFAPGMFARMRSEYKYTDTLYGSQAEYFRSVSFLPTPSNLFRVPELAGNILNPLTDIPAVGSLLEHMPLVGAMFDPTGDEYLAEKHRFDRPYPTAFSIEKLSNRTIGSMGVPGGNATGLRAYQTPGESVVEMGMNPYPARAELSPAKKSATLSTSIAHMSELSGIYKFGLWDMPFKSTNPSAPQLADAGFMNSTTRAFYDESVGGLMGHTELLRRFVMSDYLQAQRQATNTIPNTMPSWLPGSRSSFTGNTAMGVFPGDTNYHIDFSTGDPYSKIPHGELRLPGTAKEIAFRLHSGSPGIYDAVDRFMVLADVAPHSESYKHYSILVDSMLKSGTVDEYWTDKLVKTKEGVKQKLNRYATYSRKFTSIGEQFSGLVEQKTNEENQEGIDAYYTIPEQAVGAAWEVFSHDIVARLGITIPILGPMLSNKMLPVRDELDAYIKREVYDTDEYDWTKPYTTMLRPMAEQLKATDPFTATIGGFTTGVLMGANPISRIVMSTAGAIHFGGSSSIRAMNTGQLAGGYVPEYVTDRRRMDEYFDSLEYIKLRRLEKKAKVEGLHKVAAHFIDLKKRTVASLDYSLGAKQFVRDSLIALPTREKQLFMRSLDFTTSKRKEVLQYVPEYLKPVYQAAWAKQGDTSFDYSNIRRHPDARAAQSMMAHGMPGADWAGFHPDVPMNAVRVRTMDSVWGSVSNDAHRSGVFARTANRLRTEFPEPDLDIYHFYTRSGLDAAARQQLEAELMQSGITDYDINEDLGSGLENIVNYDMTSRKELDDYFRIASEILRS
jgi:hypothetical protein